MTTAVRTGNLLDHFNDQGYVVAPGLLDLELDIKPVLEEYDRLLDQLIAPWHTQGRLSSNLAGLSFSDRLTQTMIEIGGSEVIQNLEIALPQSNIKHDTPFHFGPAVFNLLTSPRLLDSVEKFIGPEILSNPIQHIRIKPPQRTLAKPFEKDSLISTTSWHQDLGVGLAEAENSNVLTVWIPIVEATVENGCLLVVPQSHKGDLALHCLRSPERDGLHIRKEHVLPGEIPLPMSPGDVLFMHKKTMHSSLANNSDAIRWSFDLRYNPIGEPTGRPFFPGFIARSQKQPQNVLRSAADWDNMWKTTRAALADNEPSTFRRWRLDDPRCA
ncbi:MAG: phytanoyl-CoA dioxygenase family protein [Chloroflexi bacterium]|nr:phytanoyl-CoA dioxygenase family protein [Chloroflexota bacterium]